MDSDSDAPGGVIGWIAVPSLPQPLARAVAAARIGALVGPISAVGGWHVMKVLGRRAAHTQPFAAARPAITASRGASARGWPTTPARCCID